MRKALGIAVIIIGGVGLSLWGRATHAPQMESAVGASLVEVLEGKTTHDVQGVVSGRDITLTGLADTQTERDALIAAAHAITGRRVVNADGLSVLAAATPYTTTITKSEAGLSAVGHVPSERARTGISELLAGAEQPLTLASGAPADWDMLVRTSTAALAPLIEGTAALTDTTLTLTGLALGPAERDAALADLAALSADHVQSDISMLDDGTPARFGFDWSALSGAAISGKLPRDMTPDAIAAALGLPVTSDVVQGLLGESADMGVWARIRAALPLVETLSMDHAAEQITITAGLAKGVTPDSARPLLEAALGRDVALDVELADPSAPDGTERTHALTGEREVLSGGYWLAVPDFAPDLATCTAQTDAALGESVIGFVSGSAELDANALDILNRLGSLLRHCTTTGGLRAEIGGHTDSVGGDDANRRLSQLRASAVRAALIERGADRAALVSRGYGASQPIADNATDAGRAQNRRTTIIWSE